MIWHCPCMISKKVLFKLNGVFLMWFKNQEGDWTNLTFALAASAGAKAYAWLKSRRDSLPFFLKERRIMPENILKKSAAISPGRHDRARNHARLHDLPLHSAPWPFSETARLQLSTEIFLGLMLIFGYFARGIALSPTLAWHKSFCPLIR